MCVTQSRVDRYHVYEYLLRHEAEFSLNFLIRSTRGDIWPVFRR